MATMSIARRSLLDGLVQEFRAQTGAGRTVLAVDGPDPVATAAFADDLGARLSPGHAVFRASVEHFQRPRAERIARGEFSAQARYLDAFDYEQLARVLLSPFRLGGSTGFVVRGFDSARDGNAEMGWLTGPQDATLVIDGVFLNRPELRGGWDFSIWLDGVEVREATAALAERDAGAFALYAADADPRRRASVVIDDRDRDDPRRLR